MRGCGRKILLLISQLLECGRKEQKRKKSGDGGSADGKKGEQDGGSADEKKEGWGRVAGVLRALEA